MDSLTKLTCKPYHHYSLPLSLHSPRTPFSWKPISSLSFNKNKHSNPPSFSLKIRASSSSSNPHNPNPNNPNPNPKLPNPTNPNPFSFLKTPLCIAITAAALISSRLFLRRPVAIAAAPPPPTAEVSGEISDEEKEKSLEQHVASNPDDKEALKTLMEVKIKNRKLPEAVEVINRLIELEPDEFELPLLRAHMYSYMGESELAKTGFEEILEKDPLRVEAYHGLVMAVSQGEGEVSSKDDLDGVLKRINEALEKCKKEKKSEEIRDFKLLIAQIRVIQGDYEGALRTYRELVKEEPRDFRPYLCQGIIYTLLRKKDEAEKQFEQYKRLVPKGHPYARYFDDNMLATKVFSQMAENERTKAAANN